MSVILSDRVTAVLARLLGDEQQHDRARLAEIHRAGRSAATLATSDGIDIYEVAKAYEQTYVSVGQDAGILLYFLARAQRATVIVEFGTSYGTSSIYLAAALRDNGGGRLITTELLETKAERAGAALEDAGLADLVEVRVGDANTTLTTRVPDEVDLVLLDGWGYLPILRILEPHLRQGAIVAADGMPNQDLAADPYIAHVREPANGYLSVRWPAGDGMELSLRVQEPL